MAINDHDLAEVWPEYLPGVSPVKRKQFLYANLVLSHINLISRVTGRDEEYLRGALAETFGSPVIRDFWAAVRDYRRGIRPEGTVEGDFDDLCEAAYQDVVRHLPDER